MPYMKPPVTKNYRHTIVREVCECLLQRQTLLRTARVRSSSASSTLILDLALTS